LSKCLLPGMHPIPSGAKAQIHFGASMARLKSCPDTRRFLETSLSKQARPSHARETQGKNAELLRHGDGGAGGKHVIVRAMHAFEQAVIDGDQHPERRATLAVDQRQQFSCGLIEVFGALGNGGQQRALVGGGRCAGCAMKKRVK